MHPDPIEPMATPADLSRFSRRQVLKRAAALGFSGPMLAGLLAACGGAAGSPTAASQGAATSGTGASASTATTPTTTTTTSATTASSTAGVPAVIKRGGSLVVDISVDPLSMDPAHTGEPQARFIRGAIADPLFDLNPTGQLIPRLVESWETKNTTTYVLHLRQGVKFQDGTPFNADAVKFNIERMVNPATKNAWADEIAQLGTVTVIDNYTVQLTSKGPFANFLVPFYDVNGMQLSPAAVQKWGANIGMHPVGAGPFQFVEYVPDQHVILERNPNYWQSGKPYLDRITFNIVPTDSTREVDLRTGAAQLIEYVPFQDINTLKTTSGIVITDQPGFRVDGVYFNCQRPPTNTWQFRQAWSWLIDRNAIQSAAYYNTGQPTWSLFLPGAPGYVAGYAPTKVDLSQAKALLAQSGVKLPIDVTYQVAQGDAVDLRVAEIIQSNVKPAGINLQIEALDPATASKDAADGNFSTNGWWWGWRPDPDQYLSVNLYTGALWNQGKYSSSQMDSLLKTEETELTQSKRIAIFRQIDALVTHDAPIVPTHAGAIVTGLTSHVQGFVSRVDGLIRFEGISLA